MSSPFKRDDWNAVIGDVNALIDSGCTGAPKLSQIGHKHVLTFDDIENVRDTLALICANQPSFDSTERRWTKAVIDEINAAIADCQCCDPHAEEGLRFYLGTAVRQEVVTSVALDITGAGGQKGYFYSTADVLVAPDGEIQVGWSGIKGRWATITTTQSTTPLTSIQLSCEGVGIIAVSKTYNTYGPMGGWCFSGDTACQDSLRQSIQDAVATYPRIKWTAGMYATISTYYAKCESCG